MAALSGSLASIGLNPLMRLLAELHKTGRLVISDGSLSGVLFVDEGRLIGAVADNERGLPAFDAIVLALGGGTFDFDENVGESELNLTMDALEFERHLAQLTQERDEIALLLPSPMVIPRPALDQAMDDEEVVLRRGAVRLLLAIDGRRRLADLVRERGLVTTLRDLVQLRKLDLVHFDAPPNEPSSDLGRPRPLGARLTEELPADATEPSASPSPATTRSRGTWPGWHAQTRRPSDDSR